MKIENYKKLSAEALEIYSGLADQGLPDETISDAMCDGEYLYKKDIPQVVAEEIYHAMK